LLHGIQADGMSVHQAPHEDIAAVMLALHIPAKNGHGY
jgi:hypothetical protein